MKVFNLIIFLCLFSGSVLAEPYYYHHRYYHRKHDPIVNTKIENKYDTNNNGWIGPKERHRMNKRAVNTPKENYCDKNNDGMINTQREVNCKY